MSSHSTPLRMVVLAPLTPLPESGYRPRLSSPSDIDQAFQDLSPSVFFPLTRDLSREAGITLTPKSLADFHPDGMISSHPYLSELAEALKYLRGEGQNASPEEAAAKLKNWTQLPLEIKLPPKTTAAPASNAVDDILSMVSGVSAAPQAPLAADGGPEKWADEIEGIIQRILGVIFTDPRFRAYEAAWRGLAKVMATGGAEVEIASVSMNTLGECLDHLQDNLFSRPPAALLIALPFDSSVRSFDLFARLADLAGNLLCPVITSIGPEFLRLKSWDGLDRLQYLVNFIDDAGYAKWRRLPKDPGAEWLCVLANRILSRPAYGKQNPIETVPFNEAGPLFVGPVWTLAAALCERVSETGWPTRFTKTPLKGSSALEASFPSDRLEQFHRIGISPFFRAPGKDLALLPEAVTVAGAPLENQFILSRLLGAIISLKENSDPGLEPNEIENKISGGVSSLFGANPPDDLEVRAEPDGRGGNFVSISFTPPREISTSGKRIELNIGW